MIDSNIPLGAIPQESFEVVAISDPTPTTSDRAKVFEREGAPKFKTITVSTADSITINGKVHKQEPRTIKFSTWEEDLYKQDAVGRVVGEDADGKPVFGPTPEWAYDTLEVGDNIIGYLHTIFVEEFQIGDKVVDHVTLFIRPSRGKFYITQAQLKKDTAVHCKYSELKLQGESSDEPIEETAEVAEEPANTVAEESPAETPAGS